MSQKKKWSPKVKLEIALECELLSVNRSILYYQSKPPAIDDVLNRIRDIWVRYPFYSYRASPKN